LDAEVGHEVPSQWGGMAALHLLISGSAAAWDASGNVQRATVSPVRPFAARKARRKNGGCTIRPTDRSNFCNLDLHRILRRPNWQCTPSRWAAVHPIHLCCLVSSSCRQQTRLPGYRCRCRRELRLQ
jgi:hypothetical protein